MAQYSLKPNRCQRTTVSGRTIKECLFPVSPEPASYDPEEFVDGFQPWPRLLAFKDGELLAKGEVFEHQTAARPKQAKHGSGPEPKQVKHGNQVIADRLYRLPAKLLISQPDRIVMRPNNMLPRLPVFSRQRTFQTLPSYARRFTIRAAMSQNRPHEDSREVSRMATDVVVC